MRYKEYFVNKKCMQFLEVGSYDTEELKELKRHEAQNVAIELDALECLRFFPNLKHLRLLPGTINPKDIVFLQGLRIISLTLNYYSDQYDEYTIDLSQFPELQYVFSRSQYNFDCAKLCNSLQTLVVEQWNDKDLSCLNGGKIRALKIFGGSLCSLNGLTELQHLHSISLFNLSKLTDISAIDRSPTLESFSIDKCGKVDIATLESLPKLRYLAIIGRRGVHNLSFLQRMPSLEYVTLDIPIEDGNLSALLNLKHSVVLSDKKNFSLKNKDLPKNVNRFKSDHIPDWLEILPDCHL